MTKTLSNRLLGGASKAVLLAAAIGAAGAIALPQAAQATSISMLYSLYTGTGTLANGFDPSGSPVAGLTINNPGTVCAGTVSCSGTKNDIGGTLISIEGASAFSNAPGTASLSNEAGSSVELINASTTKSYTVVLQVYATGFDVPTTPPELTFSNHIGGTITVSSIADPAASFGCVNTLNTGHTSGCLASGTSPMLRPNPFGPLGGTNTVPVSDLTVTPFALDEWVAIQLSPGAEINFSSSDNLQPVPEPASLTLFGSALLGLGAMRRRRRAKREAQQA